MYTANFSTSNISAFGIDPSSGALTPLPFSPLSTGAGTGPVAIAFDPYGKYMAVSLDLTSRVAVYTLNPTTGGLSAVPGSPFPTGTAAGGAYVMAFDPSGQSLYVSNTTTNDISVLDFNAGTGALAYVQNFRVRGRVESLVITAGTSPVSFNTKYAYATNHDSSDISGFSVNSTGAFATLSGSPFTTGDQGKSMAVDPRGRFAYVVTESVGPNVYPFTINGGTGALTAGTSTEANASSAPRSGTVDPSGRFLLVSDYADNSIYVYSIDQGSGTLTPVTGSPFAVGFTSATADSTSVVVDPTGRFVYVCESDSTLAAFSLNAFTGGLTAITGSPITVGTNATGLAIDPAGKYLFIGDAGANRLVRYTISVSDGSLSGASNIAVGTMPEFVAIDPSGRFLFASNFGAGTVSAFQLNLSTGGLTAVSGSPFTSGTSTFSIAVDASGRFLSAGNVGDNNLVAFTIDPGTGALAAMPGSPMTVGIAPRSVNFVSFVQ